MKLERMKITEK